MSAMGMPLRRRLRWAVSARSRAPARARSRARRRGRLAGRGGERDTGTALVEFVAVAVLIMIPIAYVVIVLVRLNAATQAVVTAAREAGRAYVTADNPGEGAARARLAAQLAMTDQGAPEPELTVTCGSGGCLLPGSRVRVTVTTRVAVPLVPRQESRGTISVTAEHETFVDTYRSSA